MRFIGDIDEITGFGAATTRAQGRVETGALALRFASGLCGSVIFSDAAPSPWGLKQAQKTRISRPAIGICGG